MRYAVYLTPPDGSQLAEAAASWLGRSPFFDAAMPPVAPPEASAHVPARYGFHATLRAPFRLADGVSELDLVAAFRHHIARVAPIVPVLTIAPLSRFLAFRSDDPALGAAARAAVEAFEPLRAPLTAADLARRQPERLDPRERELLDTWGYPYVMERFQFHMTLTGPLGIGAEAVAAAARSHFGALDKAAHPLVHAIYREDTPGGAFRVIAAQGTAANDNSDKTP
ncbi:DUF1045 domain-containing protein [Acuticoccus yangtzensis]|uniref:DUF1045 domain-containing protein n=1 Tax=Acuticoccus yangtzensis TaxID=1443441 RepID=UPI000949726A|nr:DUF1045 domain-containing protein [Acuticoccus yangtzensis]